jgi:hypothetical protein
MTLTNLIRIMILAICVALPSLWAASIRSEGNGAGGAVDFAQVYYGSRCVANHKDPYDGHSPLGELEAEGGRIPESAVRARVIMSLAVYLPTALFVLAPLGIMSWPAAIAIWAGLIAALLAVAAMLVWDLGADAADLSGLAVIFVLLNSVFLLAVGNPVGIVVPFCVIAVWCFLNHRFEMVGVVLLALSLVLKPHDAGFLWLYFLLAGGVARKRALQTLAVVAALSICTLIWIRPVSPHWVRELRGNISAVQARGGTQDPGQSGLDTGDFIPNISLESSFSILKDEPQFYYLATYLLTGALMLIWILAVLRKRPTAEGALLALAAVSALTMLPVYHLTYDAKLLLLMIPACSVLWAARGPKRWVALGLTSAAIFVTSDIPVIRLAVLAERLHVSASTLSGKLELLLLQPAPLVLLAAGCFYLWVYIRYEPEDPAESAGDMKTAVVAAT